MADKLKQTADNLFKSSKFEEAASVYEEVLEMKQSNEIILNSNLSACYFEMGISNSPKIISNSLVLLNPN
jgi:hypothetical protein